MKRTTKRELKTLINRKIDKHQGNVFELCRILSDMINTITDNEVYMDELELEHS